VLVAPWGGAAGMAGETDSRNVTTTASARSSQATAGAAVFNTGFSLALAATMALLLASI